VSLALLEKYDRRSATGILAAAALGTGHNIEGEEPRLVKAYGSEARELVSQIRKQLKIAETDSSEAAQQSISKFISRQIEKTLLEGADVNNLLASAGQAGRLNPSVYTVEQSRAFLDLFSKLSIKRANVEDAVKHPDDYQHIIDDKANESNKEIISIFLRKIISAKRGNDHWLLVQTYRSGLVQSAQSAWRVFPEVVDISEAEEPIDLLRAFANAFGVEIKIGDHNGKFVESIPAKRGESPQMSFGPSADFFSSVSKTETPDPNVVQIGAAYSIDLIKYSAFLASKGLAEAISPSRYQQQTIWRPFGL
jgi:hypothetical protein